jgi:hypothetical protein
MAMEAATGKAVDAEEKNQSKKQTRAKAAR